MIFACSFELKSKEEVFACSVRNVETESWESVFGICDLEKG